MAGAAVESGETVTQLLPVEVCYALPREQALLKLEVPEGSTLLEVIAASHILERYPQIDLRSNVVGVFGRVRELNETVKAGDRVEIYRGLEVDPKTQRHQRVEQQRIQKARARSQPKNRK